MAAQALITIILWMHLTDDGRWQPQEPDGLRLRPELQGQDPARWQRLTWQFDDEAQPVPPLVERLAPLHYPELDGLVLELVDPDCPNRTPPGELSICLLQVSASLPFSP